MPPHDDELAAQASAIVAARPRPALQWMKTRAGGPPGRGKYLIIINLSYNSPYKPPHNKRMLDVKKRKRASLSALVTATDTASNGRPITVQLNGTHLPSQ